MRGKSITPSRYSLAFDGKLKFEINENLELQQKEIVDTVSVACEDKLSGDASTPAASNTQNQLCSDNKGFKMMKMLGWTGGALGTSGDGIKEPVRFV